MGLFDSFNTQPIQPWDYSTNQYSNNNAITSDSSFEQFIPRYSTSSMNPYTYDPTISVALNNNLDANQRVNLGNTGTGTDWGQFLLGGRGSVGVAPLALGVAQTGANIWMGKQQLDLSKKQYNTQKQQFSDQFNLQKDLINQDMYNQALARYRSNPRINPTPEEYMAANKI